MKIISFSDNHGYLPHINDHFDLLCICGDWSPLEIQRDIWYMYQWLEHRLIPYFRDVDVDKIVFIAGNHDFICDNRYINNYSMLLPNISFSCDIIKPLLKKYHLVKKVSYLENNSIMYNGIKIFGCPEVCGLSNSWAFSNYFNNYLKIKKCDILLTHQPPKIGDLGYEKLLNKDFGSVSLMDRISLVKPKLCLCGHIHDGIHDLFSTKLCDEYETLFMNVAIKDDDYKLVRQPFSVII